MATTRENLEFVRAFFTEFKTTGTFFPSSKWAARELARPLTEANRESPRTPKKILEIGAGTGSVTREIVKELEDGDYLAVCELNSRLMEELQRRLQEMPEYQKRKDQIEFFEGPVQEVPEDKQFDILICALPFLNFEVELIDEIFNKLLRLSTEETVMTYFEYIGLRKLGKAVSPKKRKERIKKIESYMSEKYSPRLLNRERVWFNMLPINIYTLDMNHKLAA